MNLKKILICGAAGLIGLNCCKKEDDFVSQPDLVLSKNTKILNETQLNKISNLTENSISFSEAVNYSKGNILAAGIGPKSPEGFLRKVESISSDKKKIITSKTSLEEAIVVGEFSFEKVLTYSDLNSAESKKSKANFDNSFTYPLDFVLFDLDNNYSTTNDQIKLQGNINFKPEICFKAKFENGIKEISLESKLNQSSDLHFIGNLEKEMEFEKIITTIRFNPIPVLSAPIPIIITPKIDVKVGSKGYINGKLDFNANQELILGGKLVYSSGNWNTTPIKNKNFVGTVSSVELNAEVIAHLNERITLNVDGIVGPFMEFQEYLKMNVDVKKNPWWNLNAGLHLNAGADWGILSLYLPEINKTIFSLEDTILRANSSKEPLANLIVNPNTGNLPLKVYFDASNSTSGKKIIEYFFDFKDGNIYTEKINSNDGIFDGKTSHTYQNKGNYFPSVTIKDELGRTAKTESGIIVKEFAGWTENFEQYSEGTFPTGWIPDGNASSSGKIEIENQNKILKMEGLIGNCWGSLAYKERKISLPYEIQIKIKNGNEPLGGCHPSRASLSVRNGESWSDASFNLFYFEKDGTMKDFNNQIITKVNLDEWVKFNLVCANGKVKYFVNDQLKKEVNCSPPNYKNLEISVNEGTAKFDDIYIKSLSKK